MTADPIRLTHIDIMPTFKAGDPPPSGYLERQEWAHVQHAAGLRQRRCSRCWLWLFAQERAEHEQVCTGRAQ